MNAENHQKITLEALRDIFTKRPLEVIVCFNKKQDNLIGQMFHNEFHFDNNKISLGINYINSQRAKVFSLIIKNKWHESWKEFGRLIHTAQDFYAHTNYVKLLFEKNLLGKLEENLINELIINEPTFYSHMVHFPLDYLAVIPFLRNLLYRFFPDNSHTKMNLDSPASGNLFNFAYKLAVLRTKLEVEIIRIALSKNNVINLYQNFCQNQTS